MLLMAKMENMSYCFVVIALCIVAGNQIADATKRIVPAIFIFGDSAIDIGTNNYLRSYARANFRYNGIDFPHSKPTGRFSNGYNIGDQLAMKLGFPKSPPAFLDLVNNPTVDFKKKVQRGVNFASAGSGIFYQTGFNTWNEVVSLPKQVEQFTTVISNITDAIGEHKTAKLLSKALYIFCVGANEFFDYMRDKNTTDKQLYLGFVQSAYSQQLKNVYDMGARKFAVMGVAPIGCCPYARAINQKETGVDGCMQMLNDFAQGFYNSTLNLLQEMSSEFPNMKFSLGHVYDMTMDMLKNYTSFGFKDIKNACCGKGNYNGETGCYQPINPNLCRNRTEYLFWDLYHPSQAASDLLSSYLFTGDNKYMIPMNFSQLALAPVHVHI